MATKKKMLQAAAGSAAGGGFTAIEDVFSTYLYTGDDLVLPIVNGIDLAGEGGLVWIKSRASATSPNFDHMLFDTERGVTKKLASNTTAAEITNADTLTAFNSDGFTVDDDDGTNKNLEPYASWTFRKAPRFFDVVTYTGDGVAGRTVSHNLGIEPGCIITKRLNSAVNNWSVYHRGANPTNPENVYLSLNTTDGVGGNIAFWNNTAPTDTVFTLGNGNTNFSGQPYVAYLYAHDPLGPSEDGSDGLISCGGYAGSSSAQTITLGWEPQWILIKSDDTTGWLMFDNMRGLAVGGADKYLLANTSNAELTSAGSASYISLTATGFRLDLSEPDVNSNGRKYIYIAIRRGPMRAPESGTEVFAPTLGTASGAPRFVSGFPTDLLVKTYRYGYLGSLFGSRLTGDKYMSSASTSAEASDSTFFKFDYQNGTSTVGDTNDIGWSFRRAPGFFDVVAYTGDGAANRTVPHSLGVAPELVIVKNRDQSGYNWIVGSGAPVGWNYYLRLDSNTGRAFSDIYFGNTNTPPTDSGFYVGRSAGLDDTNRSPYLYIAYLFATLPGISKVGSYTGNGSSQTIDCGFTTGARFVLIKRTDSTGSWCVFDTARGIVAGNDPVLYLQATSAEVTSIDWIDPNNAGFEIVTSQANINAAGGNYIFYAVA